MSTPRGRHHFSGARKSAPSRKPRLTVGQKFSAAETTWFLERGFEIDESGSTARISGEITVDLVKGIKDTAMIYVLLPDDTIIGGRVLDFSNVGWPQKMRLETK
jgi:hypothetical protein